MMVDEEANAKAIAAARFLKEFCEERSKDSACLGCPFVVKREDRLFLLCGIGWPDTSFYILNKMQ